MSLVVRDLTVSIGTTTIVEHTSFDVRAGDKVGLVGRNGAGKTTLFRVLGGANPPAAGSVRRPDATGYLSQDPRQDSVPPETNCLSHVLSGRGLDQAQTLIEKRTAAMEEDPSDANIARFTEAMERFDALGGHAGEAEARRLVAGLGVADDRLDLRIDALSGGERRRLELARILFAGSDLLLLDEPTNHLDLDARDWLLAFLRSYRGALVVISHDLGLLDDAITRVLHLDRTGDDATGELVEYRGNYSSYLQSRATDEERLGRLAERQAREITRLSRRADSMRGQTAKRARVAKNLDARAARLEADRVTGPQQRRAIAVRLPDPPEADRVPIEADGLAKRFGDAEVFRDVTFDVGRGERLLIMGLNGAGKTTLLRLLAADTTPTAGTVHLARRTSVGYYAQEHEGLDPDRSLLDHVRMGGQAAGSTATIGDREARSVMGMFGLSGDKAFQNAGTLSGGEKTKLALAQLVVGGHNLLLLDEPTNNLDPPSRTAIGAALADWPGTIVLVSHDPEFVQALAPDRVLLMPEGQLDYFDESMLDLVALS
jgi:ATPase subunit of ABC transporter with duplicated ATPase domains